MTWQPFLCSQERPSTKANVVPASWRTCLPDATSHQRTVSLLALTTCEPSPLNATWNTAFQCPVSVRTCKIQNTPDSERVQRLTSRLALLKPQSKTSLHQVHAPLGGAMFWIGVSSRCSPRPRSRRPRSSRACHATQRRCACHPGRKRWTAPQPRDPSACESAAHPPLSQIDVLDNGEGFYHLHLKGWSWRMAGVSARPLEPGRPVRILSGLAEIVWSF